MFVFMVSSFQKKIANQNKLCGPCFGCGNCNKIWPWNLATSTMYNWLIIALIKVEVASLVFLALGVFGFLTSIEEVSMGPFKVEVSFFYTT